MPFMSLFKKCKTCPYALGTIKCVISPCRECILNRRKTNPFNVPVEEKHTRSGGTQNK